jgi:hypothetical protein
MSMSFGLVPVRSSAPLLLAAAAGMIVLSACAEDPQERIATQSMTAAEVDAMKQQLSECWNVPSDMRKTDYPAVEIRAAFNRDGSLAHAEIVDAARMDTDPLYRTVALGAYRAVQLCSPLRQMPAEKYYLWKNVTLNFDPKETVDQ